MSEAPRQSGMARFVCLGLAAASIVLGGGCTLIGVSGSGPIVSEARTVEAFTTIEAQQGVAVEVQIGPVQHVEVRAPSNIVPLVTTTSSGGTLRIGVDGRVVNSTNMVVAVVVPSLQVIRLSGGSRATLSGWSAPSLLAELSGGSVLDASGTIETFTLVTSGGARAELREVAATYLIVDASGGSVVEAQVSDEVAGFASGGARVLVAGDAVLNVEVSGGANVERSD